jgi:hypothetical protein
LSVPSASLDVSNALTGWHEIAAHSAAANTAFIFASSR